MLPGRARRELPPTAGLPLAAPDLLNLFGRPAGSLADGLAAWLGIPPPVLTCSGTAALIVTLRALRSRSPGRNQVIVPAYTCPLVPLVRHFVPGTEVLVCDLLPSSIDLDPERLAALCSERTLAVVVTHLGGRVANTGTAVHIARHYGAAVIEDAAQAMGAFQEGRSVGLQGDVGFFSLAVGKGLTMYEGGVLFSKEPELHARLAETANRLPAGLFWNARRMLELLVYAAMYRPSLLWYAYGRGLCRNLDRNDEIAAVGDDFSPEGIALHRPDALRPRIAAAALHRLPDFLDQGRCRARARLETLRSAGLAVLDDAPDRNGVWPFLMALAPDRARRDAILARLWRQGLGVSKLFIHALPDYPFLPFLAGQDCPNARDLADRMFTITNSPWLDDAAFDAVLKELRA